MGTEERREREKVGRTGGGEGESEAGDTDTVASRPRVSLEGSRLVVTGQHWGKDPPPDGRKWESHYTWAA